jgi:hypothetical protein
VLQRILAPGSDRAGVKWAETVHARAFAALRLPHYYRPLRVLWEKNVTIEEALYEKGLDLFNQPLDLVFSTRPACTSRAGDRRAWPAWARPRTIGRITRRSCWGS